MNEMRYVQIGLVIAVIIAYGYYACWWGGPHPLVDANWCPASCWLGGDGGDGGDGGSSANIICPPIDAKLRQTDNAALNAASQACLAGGQWHETSTMISCSFPPNNIDCNQIMQMPLALKLIYDAQIFGAIYHCQPDWLGIWCPGDGALPYPAQSVCGWSYTTGQSEAQCGGPCSASQECVENGDTCGCVDTGPEDYPCGGNPGIEGGIMTCEDNGICPPGQTCTVHDAPLNGNAYCYCSSML